MKMSILTSSVSGTPYLSTYLQKHGIETELISIDHKLGPARSLEAIEASKLLDDIIVDYIKKDKPDAVGVSTINIEYIAENLSKLDIPLILGGPNTLDILLYVNRTNPGKQHYTFGIEGLPIDLPKLLTHINDKNVNLKDIRGLVYNKNDELKHNSPIWTKSYYLDNKPDLNFTFPHEALERANKSLQFWIPDTFGCQYAKCTFCSSKKPVLSFTPKEIVGLIKDVLVQEPEKPIHLISESPHKIGNICKELKKQELHPKYLGFTSRADYFLEKYNTIVEALETGICLDLSCIGFESFLDEDLIKLNKGVTAKQNLQAVTNLRKLADKHINFNYKNPNLHGLIPFLPWSTPKTIYENFKILKDNEMWDVFMPEILTNYLQYNVRDNLKKEMLDFIAVKNNSNIKISRDLLDIGNYSAIYWAYAGEDMSNLSQFNVDSFRNLMKGKKNDVFATKFDNDTRSWVENTSCIEISKNLIEQMVEKAGSMINK